MGCYQVYQVSGGCYGVAVIGGCYGVLLKSDLNQNRLPPLPNQFFITLRTLKKFEKCIETITHIMLFQT